MPMWLIILLVILVVIVLWVISTYNSLVGLKNKVKDQWAQIDTVLKRRFDLIPNLVETVKGYAKHESETLENVVKARNTYVSATTPEDQMKANGELTQAISKLFALSESYPDLKANTNFMDLQKELTETEDKIQYARQFYNDVVMKYNNACQYFPGVIIANMFNFKPEVFFQANDEERQNVKVQF
jgi:LemA protein